MVPNWKSKYLADLIEIRHGFAFSGGYISEDPAGDILLTPGNFAVGGGFKGDRFKYYRGPVPQDFVLEEGDLLVTMTDLSKQADTLGFPAFVPTRRAGRQYLHNQRLGKVVVRPEAPVDLRFLFYVLCSAPYRHEILAGATGTTVKHTSPKRIGQYRFDLPPISEQRAIAIVLKSLDDKIELNRLMSETLDEVARGLFKETFLGEDSTPLAGVQQVPVQTFFELLSGGTPKTSEAENWGGPIPWFSVADTPPGSSTFVLDTAKTITERGIKASPAQVVPAWTTIISARGTVGKLAMAGVPLAFNQSCYGLRATNGAGPSFVYLLANHIVEKLKALSHGSVFSTITRSTFDAVQFPCPSEETLTAFEARVAPLYQRILVAVQESAILAELRDALLPKLISGEIRVPEAEQFVSEVA